jgi:hypothetical protein
MDDLLAHYNRTRKFFMALVISSFAIAPVTIVLAILALSPPFLASAGQPFDVAMTVHEKQFAPYPGDAAFVRIVPEGNDSVMILNTSSIDGTGKVQTFMLDRSQVVVEYVPAGTGVMAGETIAMEQMPPRFMYVGAAPAQPFDVTWIIVLLVALSAGIAGAWLYAGVREYRFFADWNRRYASYKLAQEKVDKELDGSTG